MSTGKKPSPPETNVSRRGLLVGAGAAALLAACEKVPAPTGESADAAAPDADAGQLQPDVAVDAAADVASDVTATAKDVAADVAVSGPPYFDAITPNERWYVTSCCTTPQVDAASWVMTIKDRGKVLTTLDLPFLESLKPRDREHTLECISGGPAYNQISNGVWYGLPLPEILAAKGIQVPAGVTEMKMTALDGYATGLPTSDLALPMWLVWKLNGVPLPPEHGFPVRTLVPNRYGMKNPKWLKELEFVDQPFIGFWESQGWSKTAFYRPNAYIKGPASQALLKAGKNVVFGVAYAGRDPVVKVELRIDNGPWQPTTLDYFAKQDVWTLWHFDWQADLGAHALQARCTTASGAMSEDNPEGSDPLSGYDGSMAISVSVA